MSTDYWKTLQKGLQDELAAVRDGLAHSAELQHQRGAIQAQLRKIEQSYRDFCGRVQEETRRTQTDPPSDPEDQDMLRSIQEGFRPAMEQLSREKDALLETLQQMLDQPEPEPQRRHFDKKIPLANIRLLLRQRGTVRLGDIEREAGCTPGYMSRLEKEGSTGSPSAEFLATAADMLGVSLDRLVRARLDELNPTEEYLLNFFDGLICDTMNDNLLWERDTISAMSDAAYPLGGQLPQGGFGFVSGFGADTPACDCSLHAALPTEAGVVYIIRCRQGSEVFYELYIHDPAKRAAEPVCTTRDGAQALNAAADQLYRLAGEACDRVRLSAPARSAIDRYLNGRA